MVKRLFKDYELLICNDGSNDRTAELAEQMVKENPHIRVFHNSKNMGIGYTYRKGIRLAKKKYCMWVPGDNEVTGDGISNMLKHIGEADLVVSYIQNVGIRPWYRQIISGSFTNFMRILFNIKLNHFLGMVLCKTELIKKLKLNTNSGSLWAEIIIKLIKVGYSYKQVPVMHQKKEMSGNIFRLKNVFGILNTVMKLFVMFQILRSKKILK